MAGRLFLYFMQNENDYGTAQWYGNALISKIQRSHKWGFVNFRTSLSIDTKSW